MSSIDPRILQAVIAGGFVALGWVVNSWRNRREARMLRAEKLRDFHRALYAEIGTHLQGLRQFDEAGYPEDVLARMDAEPGFVPLIPREEWDAVYGTLLPEIHILPRQTIDPIVVYYAQIRAVARLVEDMRGERFGLMDQDRRMAMYRDYIAMRRQAYRFGYFALLKIDAFGKGGAEAADAVRLPAPVSSPGAGLSATPPGSG